MKENYECIKELIYEADFILIGCGEELSAHNNPFIEEERLKYVKKRTDTIQEEKYAVWLEKILSIYFYRNYKGMYNPYEKLYQIIKGKMYFIVSTNTDSLIFSSQINKERITMPCGSEIRMQCSGNCRKQVWENKGYIENIIYNLDLVTKLIVDKQFEEIEKEWMPICPHCHQKAELNIRSEAEEYEESGYLDSWNKYLTWLSGTLNKKLVLLELGEGFLAPGIIRWPFEKTAYLNQKASFIRVNEKFPQITEEIKDKAISVKENVREFLDILFQSDSE